jgi:hypothetical protein
MAPLALLKKTRGNGTTDFMCLAWTGISTIILCQLDSQKHPSYIVCFECLFLPIRLPSSLIAYIFLGQSCTIDQTGDLRIDDGVNREHGSFTVHNAFSDGLEIGATCEVQVPGQSQTDDLTFFVSTKKVLPGETIYLTPTNNLMLWLQQIAPTGAVVKSTPLPRIQFDAEIGRERIWHVTYTKEGIWRQGTPDD